MLEVADRGQTRRVAITPPPPWTKEDHHVGRAPTNPGRPDPDTSQTMVGLVLARYDE